MALGVNRAGVDWLLIKAWLLDEIDKSHAALEGLSPINVHDYHRGRIALIRDLIKETEPAATPEAEDQKDYV